MARVADWQLDSWSQKGMRWPKWDWTNGACYAGLMALSRVSHDPKYLNALLQIGDDLDWQTGPHRFKADDYCVGQMFSQIYMIYKKPEMIKAFRLLADSIISLPHSQSLEWTNDIALHEWAWCDALFMGPPALAYLSSATGDPRYLDTACALWWKTTDYLFDPTENLYFRDSRYFTMREANGKKMFWSRGNGWVLAGLVRMLDNMPKNYPGRSRFVELYLKMSRRIASLQSADGSWHTSLLDPEAYPAKETSGTGFYCYALAWGINHKLLKQNRYRTVVQKAWAALESSVHPDGMLGNVQQIGAQPGAVDSNDTEVYGTGAFLLAGSQMWEMQRQEGTLSSGRHRKKPSQKDEKKKPH
ncbi:MAG: glycoside hydrolase family 88 protein [Bacteroidota bacterium]|nr:glycoside hydrolase family 88 protein [Bacteroidota bacterium]